MNPGIYKIKDFPWYSSDMFSMHIYIHNGEKINEVIS